MLQSLLTVENLCWHGDRFQAAPDTACDPADVQGRFACASSGGMRRVTLARDRLGLNKLFVAVQESGAVVAASYLVDLLRHGAPFESISSVPAGHILTVDTARSTVTMQRFARLADGRDARERPAERLLGGVLETWFARLAAQFGRRQICVCLSGSAASALIAALAREYFIDVTAYTYTFVGPGASLGGEAAYAERLAADLRIPFRLVPAGTSDVVEALEDAMRFGQDWRDFNVHLAIVNEILARAICADMKTTAPGTPPIVITGEVPPAALRLALVAGFDAGDAEVGVFARHGLTVVQPYSLVVDDAPALPESPVEVRRAAYTGIESVLARRGCDAAWMRNTFCRLFEIHDEALLDGFIRAGRYRPFARSMRPRSVVNGYITV